jgi:hypothetical protein
MDTISNPTALIAKYTDRAPASFEEMLEAEVASFEQTFAQGAPGLVPFVRMLTDGEFEHLDLTPQLFEAGPEFSWDQAFPQLIRAHGAQVFGTGMPMGELTPQGPALFADCRVIDGSGRLEVAQCLIEGSATTPGVPCRRVSEWYRVTADPAGQERARAVVAALRANDRATAGARA